MLRWILILTIPLLLAGCRGTDKISESPAPEIAAMPTRDSDVVEFMLTAFVW